MIWNQLFKKRLILLGYPDIKTSYVLNIILEIDGKRYMRVKDEDVPYSEDFQLYMIYRGASEEMMPEYELQTR